MDRRTLLYTSLGGLTCIGIGTWISGFKSKSPAAGNLERFISLHPSITDTIYHLAGEKNLVGHSDFCSLPEQAANLPNVGTSLKPNLEKLVSLQPSHIFIDGASGVDVKSLQ